VRRASRAFVGIVVAAMALGVAAEAEARLIAADQFIIGADPGIGEYTAGDLAWNANQNPTIPGFSGGWQNGTAATGTWDAATNGLTQGAACGTGGGRVAYSGYGGGARRVYRNVSNPPSSSVYYFNALLRLDTDSDLTGLNVGGFYRNLSLSDTAFFNSNSARDQEGLGFGFQGNGSQIDLVLRHRYDADPAPGNQGHQMHVDTLLPGAQVGETYRIVAKLEMNAEPTTTGNDRVSIWISPQDFTAEALAGPPTMQFVDFSLSNTNNLDRLVFASNSLGNRVSYDEMRLATTWRDAAALLYHNSFDGAQGTQPPGFVAFTQAGMESRNYGNSEYEQRRVSGGPTAIAAYSVLDDIDRGAWRDVTAQALFRYSGGGNNRNGFILRARDLTGAFQDGTQDFYTVREVGGTLEVWRFNNGSSAPVGSVPIPGGAYGTTEHLVQVSIENIPNPHTDHVAIRAIGYNGTTEASGVKYDFTFTDTSTNAITRAGGVGFRSYNGSNGTRSTYDDLRVYADNPRLLWYDDYSDRTAPRMQVFGRTVATSGGTYSFNPGGTAIATIDFDEFTSLPEWEDVAVSATMRLHSAVPQYSGLILRETGVAGATGSGEYYMYRISQPNSRAELWRVTNGSTFSLLDTAALTAAQMPNHTDIFLQMFADTLDGGAVYLRGVLSLDPDFDEIFGVIDYMDFSPDRILGPGSVGFRIVGNSYGNFDNFTVETFQIPEPATLALLGLGAIGLLRRRRKA